MIVTNIKSVMRQVDTYKLDLKVDIKATRDEMAATAMGIMKKTVSSKRAYTGRGATKKFMNTGVGVPPAKRTGLLFRTIKARKWNKVDQYGASVGLPKRSKAYYGKILEKGSKPGGKGAHQHKWAEPSMRKFEPLSKAIIEKNLGRIK